MAIPRGCRAVEITSKSHKCLFIWGHHYCSCATLIIWDLPSLVIAVFDEKQINIEVFLNNWQKDFLNQRKTMLRLRFQLPLWTIQLPIQ